MSKRCFILVLAGILTSLGCRPSGEEGSSSSNSPEVVTLPESVSTDGTRADLQVELAEAGEQASPETPASAASEAEAEAAFSPGLPIGAEAPTFALSDQDGQMRTLEDLLRDAPVALVFYRSADWWPYCQKQLVQLRDDLPQLTDAGVRIVGVSYDSPEILKAFSDSAKIPFPLLSDTESKVIKAFGIHNQRGLPHPGTIVVDRDGFIRAKIFVEGYRDRHDTATLLDAISTLDLE